MENRTDYRLLREQLQGIIDTDPHAVPVLSNASALLAEALPEINWAGFYLLRENRLVLGPFQGKPACIHIGIGKGVCGTAVLENRPLLVPDVHRFPGHIACDSASRSEIVLPFRRPEGGEIIGILDIDSPVPDRFREEDLEGLGAFARLLEERVDWTDLFPRDRN